MEKLEIVHGAESHALTSDRVRLYVTKAGGHMAPVQFDLEGRIVSPYSLAPWLPNEREGYPPLLRILRGDFFCLPFGESEGEKWPHGDPANEPWDLVSRSPQTLVLRQAGGRLEGVVFEKRLRLRPGECSVYIEHRISGLEGFYNFGTHPILKLSETGPARLSVSPFRWGSVYPGLFSDPAARHHQGLKMGGTFDDLGRVPTADGGEVSLKEFPFLEGCEDLVMMVSQPAQFAWSCLVQDGYAWVALKDPSILPNTLFWISNGGRKDDLWAGKHVARIGIEEVCSWFHEGRGESESRRGNPHGVETGRDFSRDQSLSVRTIHLVQSVPDDFGQVADIGKADGGILLVNTSGTIVFAPVAMDFLWGREDSPAPLSGHP